MTDSSKQSFEQAPKSLPPFVAYEADLASSTEPEGARIAGLPLLACGIVTWGMKADLPEELRTAIVREFRYECGVVEQLLRKWLAKAGRFDADTRLEHVTSHQAYCTRLTAELEGSLTGHSIDQERWGRLIYEYDDLLKPVAFMMQANAEDLKARHDEALRAAEPHNQEAASEPDKSIWDEIPDEYRQALEAYECHAEKLKKEGKRPNIAKFCQQHGIDKALFRSYKEQVRKRRQRSRR